MYFLSIFYGIDLSCCVYFDKFEKSLTFIIERGAWLQFNPSPSFVLRLCTAEVHLHVLPFCRQLIMLWCCRRGKHDGLYHGLTSQYITTWRSSPDLRRICHHSFSQYHPKEAHYLSILNKSTLKHRLWSLRPLPKLSCIYWSLVFLRLSMIKFGVLYLSFGSP